MLKRSGSPTAIGCPKSAMSSGKKSKLTPSSRHSAPKEIAEWSLVVMLIIRLEFVRRVTTGPNAQPPADKQKVANFFFPYCFTPSVAA